MSKVPSYLYRKVKQAKRHHDYVLFEDLYLIKLIPNTQYRQNGAGGSVVFEITSDTNQDNVCSFALQGGALYLSWFDAKNQVWWPFQSDNCLHALNFESIEKLAEKGFYLDRNSHHNLYRYDLTAMLVKRFGGTWQVFDDYVLKDGLLKIRHDLRVENGFLEGTSDWDMSGQINSFGNDVAEKIERFKSNNLPKIYADIQSGDMTLNQFLAKFGGA